MASGQGDLRSQRHMANAIDSALPVAGQPPRAGANARPQHDMLNNLVDDATRHGPSELTRIAYLDGWRGMAISLVLVSHFLQLKVVDVGRLGVDIFFVLSGMLMANILFIRRVELATFYKRRFSRIFPAFFVFVTSISLASWLFALSAEHENYLYNLLFLRAYWPEDQGMWYTGLPLNHLWSLHVEEHAYLVLSFITLLPLIRRYPWIAILALGLSSIALQYVFVLYPDLAARDQHLRSEIAGSFIMLSAAYCLVKHHVARFVPGWLPLLTLILAVVSYSELSPHWSARWALAPFLLAFTVNHLDLLPALWRRLLSLRPLRLLGIWSFSIYLWQEPLAYYGVARDDFFSAWGVILLLCSIGLGAASFYWIENPARRYINERW